MINRERARILTTCLCLCVLALFSAVAMGQRPPTEAEAFDVIKRATNPTLKLAAAEDFVARFPQSSARPTIAELITSEILTIRDGAVAIALLERAHAILTGEQEREILKRASLHAHVRGEKFEAAFALASEMIAADPKNLQVLIEMNQAGINQGLKGQYKLINQALQYGLTAISIIEKDIKPEKISDEQWAIHKADLWFCYRNTAILYLALQEPNIEESKTLSSKASALKPLEPFNFALKGQALDLEYSKYLPGYEKMADGPSKQEMRKKLDTIVDEIINAWARAVGLATGQPQHQDLIRVYVPALTKYYLMRNNESTAGLKELINKHRLPLY